MNKIKIKFHQQTVQELRTEKMNNVFEMLKKQQDGISALLQKYQNTDQQNLDEFFSHRNKIKTKSKQKKQLSSKKYHSLNKYESNEKILLPEIKSISKNLNSSMVSSNEKKKKKISQTLEVGKSSLRKELEKIYAENKKFREKNEQKLKKSRSKRSRLTSDYSQFTINDSLNYNQERQNAKISLTSPNLASIELSKKQSDTIPKPLGMSVRLSNIILENSKNNEIDQPQSDQDQEDIPLVQYQKQFKKIMASQCIEQINYLYFSKNESIKDWSQALLGMFQKHDKQILGLRTKMKYLQRFDEHYFAVDIYKN